MGTQRGTGRLLRESTGLEVFLRVASAYCTKPRGAAHMTEQLTHILGQTTYLNAEKNSRCVQATSSWEHRPHR